MVRRGKTVIENGGHHLKSSCVEGAVFFGIAVTEKGHVKPRRKEVSKALLPFPLIPHKQAGRGES
jgi:hypothetical protein